MAIPFDRFCFQNFEEKVFPFDKGILLLIVVAVLVIHPNNSRLYVVHYLLTNLIQYPDSGHICAGGATKIMG